MGVYNELHRDNGKENANYRDYRLYAYCGYVGVMEEKMKTTKSL